MSGIDEAGQSLGDEGAPPSPAPQHEPPADVAGRESDWAGDHGPAGRDIRPALGTRGEPAEWKGSGPEVRLARPRWGDAVWSFLYKRDTDYAAAEPAPDQLQQANRRMRGGELPVPTVHGPFIKPPVWTWEVPLYFWVGGIAAGSSFVGLACDVVGDRDSAAIARRVALGAVATAPPLLVADLGRPERFLNMMRIVKPRSPMNLGAWCLAAFSTVGAAAVAADLVGLRRTARLLGGANALLGGYLGSYTGVLLASTAVPLWARSRMVLGPIFVATATATGAAACRLTLAGAGTPPGHPSRHALARLETGAMLAELALSSLNERRLGVAGEALRRGRGGMLFRGAKQLVRAGLAVQLVPGERRAAVAQNVASVCFLAAGLAFRFAWVEAGKTSARDDRAVALVAREGGRVAQESDLRPPLAGGRIAAAARIWSESVRRASLLGDRLRA